MINQGSGITHYQRIHRRVDLVSQNITNPSSYPGPISCNSLKAWDYLYVNWNLL